MEFITNLAQHPATLIGFIIITIYLLFWIFVSVAIVVSPRAREYFQSFFPQWFGRNGRPFTTHEKIGAAFQGVALVLIIALLLM